MSLNASQMLSNNEFAMFNKQIVQSRQSYAVNQLVGMLAPLRKLGCLERFTTQV